MHRRREKKIRIGKYKISEDVLRDSLIMVMNAKEAKEDAEVAQAEPYVFSDSFEKKMDEIMQVKKSVRTEEILKCSLQKDMDQRLRKLDEEMANSEPYVFSEKFNKNMEKILRGETRKNKLHNIVRYTAATLVTVLLVGGLIFIGNENARASKVGIEIQDWLDDFFVVEEKSQGNDGVLFEESQIGYLPDGFEKVEEEVFYSKVTYKYQNDVGEYIILEVYRDKSYSMLDNKDIIQEVHLNEAGLEYRFINTEDTKANGIVWTDLNNKFYSLTSTLSKEKITNMMDAISY